MGRVFQDKSKTGYSEEMGWCTWCGSICCGRRSFAQFNLYFDPTQTIAGVDPLVMIGLTTFGGMLTSYLAGGALAGMLWRRFRPGTARLMDTKQKDFYERIVKHRANVAPDPTKVNFSFDYYGEKINSVADYRQWLRKQRQLLRDRTFK